MTAPVAAYVSLADSLRENPASSAAVRQLPALDEASLTVLTHAANARALALPRRGWELLLLASLAGRAQRVRLGIQAGIDLQLSLLAGQWGVPRRGAYRARRAERVYRDLGLHPMEAACRVALNLMPWTRPHFRAARDELENALGTLQAAGSMEWTAHGLHALAFADMLTGRLEAARERLQAAKSLFHDLGDELNALRVTYTEGGWHRRAGQADRSMDTLVDLQAQFEARGARGDMAKTRYQIGMNELVRGEDHARAQKMLEEVEDEFRQLEMHLWAAQARSGQAQAAANQGHLTRARALREPALRTFARHGTLGLQADNLNDQAKLYGLHGDLQTALEHIDGAIRRYEQLGAVPSAINSRINKGRFLIAQSRYQRALGTLERARDLLATLDNPSLLAFCQLQLGYVWLGLGNSAQALEVLQAAVASHERTERPGLGAEALQAMAHCLQRLGQPEDALHNLRKTVELATASGDAQVQSGAQRQIAEILQASGDLIPARDALEAGLALAGDLDLTLELAAALTVLGELEAAAGRPTEAEKAWKEALRRNAAIMPEIDARIQLGRARQAEKTGQTTQAVASSQEGIAALKRIRREFWQPRLAGEYSRRWQADAAWAVGLAAASGDASAALNAIEATKAQAFVRHELGRRASRGEEHADLSRLQAEAIWLMDELRATPAQRGRRDPRRQRFVEQLSQARQAYNELAERVERQQLADGSPSQRLPLRFDLDHFRARASARYGAGWLALDYHLNDRELVCVWISPAGAGVGRATVSDAEQIALDACRRANALDGSALQESDLERLGSLLIPAAIRETLEADTTLLIAAHDLLHDVPWAAIQIAPGAPLAAGCLPLMTPSLEAWLLLTARRERPLPARPSGLVVAVSEFENHFSPLPAAAREADLLAAHPALQTQVLSGAAATPAAVQMALGGSGAPKDFLHLTTHLIADRQTGRLSGIVFPREILLLDDLGMLADWPALTVLSGCNGTRALTFPGDERQDFVSTLLLAGANHLVGSIWKIVDELALPIVDQFYTHLAQSGRPHAALAAAQRRLIDDDAPWTAWGGFQAVGV